MPDNLTVYLTDDHANGGLYKFVMDAPGELSSGTLHAARLQQKSTTVQGTGGTFMVGALGAGAGAGAGKERDGEGAAAASGPGCCGWMLHALQAAGSRQPRAPAGAAPHPLTRALLPAPRS
jgi:hypothetical protein